MIMKENCIISGKNGFGHVFLRKSYLLSFILIIFFSNCIGFYSTFAQEVDNKSYHDGIVIVKFKDDIGDADKYKSELISILSQTMGEKGNFILKREFPNSKRPSEKYNKFGVENVDITSIYRISFSEDQDVAKIISLLNKQDYFEYVEPLYKLELLYVPDDPMNQTDQYWLNSVHAFDAWDVHQGDTNIVIGISDTGIELSHPDLIYNIKYNYNDMPDGVDNDLDGFTDNFRGWNFAEDNNIVQADINYHGAWVSGIAAAHTDNGIGVSGAGFKCKILPLKIANADGVLVNSYQSIVYAADHGCDVVNCSWGGTSYQNMGQDVVNYAVINNDVLIVSAAGNTNSDVAYYPASYENVVSVAGTQMDDQKWSPDNSISSQGSSYSYYVDVCAPATNFRSTGAVDGYTLMWGGTSFASPIVAGCAGILRSYYPDYSANQIAELLKASADNIDTIPYNIPYAGKLGGGRLNIYNALTIDAPPAVSFHDIEVLQSEDSIFIDGIFTNYLSDAENLTITAEIISNYGDLENETVFVGSLLSLENFNSNGDIVIICSENTPYDHKLVLKLNYNAELYQSQQIIEVYVKPGYKNITTDNLELSVAPSGRFGFSDVNSRIGDGFMLGGAFSLFYDCGIIAGISATELYSSVRQVSDFNTVEYPYYVEETEISDTQIKTEFTDSNDYQAYGLRIIEDVYSWLGADNKDFIIVDYQIINESIYDIEDFYFGLFADWDLVESGINSAIFDNENNFMYCRSDNSQTMYAGIKLLSNHEVNNYGLPQIEDGDGTLDITDGFTDIEKFYMISHSNNGYSESSTDIVIYTGAGSLSIASGDTATIGFALIAAESIYNINNALINSMEMYNEVLHPQSVEEIMQAEIVVFPNPASDFLIVNSTIASGQNSQIELYNELGEMVYRNEFSKQLVIELEDFSAGLYSIKICGANINYRGKFIKLD